MRGGGGMGGLNGGSDGGKVKRWIGGMNRKLDEEGRVKENWVDGVVKVASKLYEVNATIIIMILFVLYCLWVR